VFAIGYNVQDERLDNSFYDLLASEARLASFVAIAKGDATEEHWFRLGRPQTPVDSTHALVSWTASMFEYLMPLLVMRDYNPSLLGQTYKAVVERQINYGNSNNVPWGISEAAYNARDLQLNYQYGPFGVPGLGLKRGLSEELVVAPYATALAGMIDPRSALRNFRHLEREEALGQYGFYESIDYTPERVPPTQKKAVVHAYMAHHQGMILVALDNILNDGIMQQRFHDEPIVQATQMLLQERIPKGVAATRPHAEEVLTGKVVRTMTGRITSVFDTPFLPTPRTQILSNGKYSVMMTNAGSGFSQCGGIAVTRWREDTTCDPWGSFCYIRDIGSGKVWSAGFQPTRQEPDEYEAAFSEDRIVLSRLDGEIFTKTEIIVSPEDNAEIRCVSITNHSSKPRDFHLTSYLEVVIAAQEADKAHPAFSNLFIETEFIHANNSLLARRRPRSAKDAPVWAIHTLTTDSEIVGSVSYETDRARFLGRGHDVSNPVAVMENRPLSNTVGAVLDPIFSLRCQVSVDPRETVRIFFSTGIAESRNEALALADKYHNPSTFEREVALAWTRSHVEMRHLNIDAGEAYLYQRLGARILYSDPSLRPRPRVLELNSGRQSDIWAYGISGDLPLVLVRIARVEDLSSIRRLLHGHEYLRLKGLKFDLVIMNDHPSGYVQSLHDELLAIVKTSSEAGLLGQNGGIFLLRADQMPDRDRILLHTIARAVIVTDRGSIEDQLLLRPITSNLPGEFVPEYPTRSYPESTIEFPELLFSNGLGGFKADGKEYVTMLGEDQWTPAPWSNIVANKNDFGFQVSETGAGYTWSINSRENRLTPWSNDAVSDPPGEAIYLRDEDTGTVWSPTPLPIREVEPYLIRHGQGYSVFQHQSHGIEQELLMFVPTEDQVKISRLRLRNKTGRKRRISVTSYSELVLGTFRERSAPFLITEIDPKTGTIFARNPFNNEFSERVAFATIAGKIDSATCDRKEFFGRNGSRAKPAAMFRRSLSGRDGAGLDPCAAIKTLIELQPDEEREIIILLGEESSKERAAAVAAKFSDRQTVRNSFAEVKDYWDELLGAIEVKTPDPALDIIVNRWLLYQSLACRVWARTAFYQSGGAIGFRDQLQDVMALVYSHPEITRDQILTAAAHQFKEGDVQHWWHPPTGRGVRTRFSDDLLWLPFVTAFYVRVTGDRSVLDEIVPFIDAPLLNEGQDDLYTQPTISSDEGTVLEHCSRAVDRSLTTGEHGLPLMGSGDWNDGMSSVGNKGKGESVWLGWFLLMVIEEFLQFCVSKEEHKRRKTYRAYQKDLAAAMEKDGWDGQWYRRAFFDDGTPLGSAQNEECRIDSIPQSWGLISGFADRERAAYAMASVEEYLIRRGDGLVLLFTPPFDTGLLDPGYIKGYLPGVRENGGQYTHAAIWTVIAYTILGDGDRAGELFALLNPINHASTRAGLHKYKVEPYVAAGDVYGIASHLGRGGWTWYTGSAGWMYRSAIENILGFTLIGGKILQITPCIPRSWREFEMIYRRERTEYHIRVENPTGVCQGIEEMRLDGAVLEKNEIILSDDEQIHEVKIVLGSNQPASVDDGPL
ncbi:MAG: GH36-type glycosyl hydrolase domain-containing protein, partial [Pyrinomonadaceae bacterium]